MLAIVLAAAARFSESGEFDPLAPFVRAGELLRRRPASPLLAGLRALVLAGVGIALILRPELSLEAIAVVAGAWVLYVAVGELLAILAPPLPDAAPRGGGWRQFRPGRVAVAGGLLVAVLVITLIAGGEDESYARPPGAPDGLQRL